MNYIIIEFMCGDNLKGILMEHNLNYIDSKIIRKITISLLITFTLIAKGVASDDAPVNEVPPSNYQPYRYKELVKSQPQDIKKLDASFLLEEKGYIVIPSLLNKYKTNEFFNEIRTTLLSCAKELNCSYEEYLKVVSRWASPSLVTDGISKSATPIIQDFLQEKIGEVELIKLNIISKTPYSPGPIPFHQDISYSLQSIYDFSVWLALTDAPLESGPMEVIPKSHKGSIETAVDFWALEYKEAPPPHSSLIETLSVKTGDAIIFDSKLWHRSGNNNSLNERFALVTRWKKKDSPTYPIPALQPKCFGMWTCQKETEEILARGLHLLYNKKTLNYLDLLRQWEDQLLQHPLSFLEDQEQAKINLRHVRLLYQAFKQHNGADSQGVLYKQLWGSLLNPLSIYLKHFNEK